MNSNSTQIDPKEPLSLEQEGVKRDKSSVSYRLRDLLDYLEERRVEVLN